MKVIQFPFKKALTKRELSKLEKRIDKIGTLIDMCDPDKDSDVLDNLETELDTIMLTIQRSINILERKAN